MTLRKEIVCNKTAPCPAIDGCGVDGSQNLPVGLEEASPRRLSLAIGSRFDAVGLQDVPDSCI